MTITKSNINDYLHQVVKIADLQNIYDLWMILIRPKDSSLTEDEGILSFVGTETNQESDKLHNKNNIIIPIYHDSIELSCDIYYEE